MSSDHSTVTVNSSNRQSSLIETKPLIRSKRLITKSSVSQAKQAPMPLTKRDKILFVKREEASSVTKEIVESLIKDNSNEGLSLPNELLDKLYKPKAKL